jgi:dTDP-4-amino-4,6-dideoxygalactose transaminase/glycosyltransferase involved in cell wall biosynthesis
MVAYAHYFTDARIKNYVDVLLDARARVEVFALGKERGTVQDNNLVVKSLDTKYQGDSSVRYILSQVKFLLHAFWHLAIRSLSGRYDLVHVHNMPDMLTFAALPLKLVGTKVILDIHDTSPETFATKFGYGLDSVLVKALVRQELMSAACADRVIATNVLHKEVLVGHGIETEKIELIMNVGNEKIFKPRRVHPNGQELWLSYHGTIAERLGVFLIIDALALLRHECPSLRFLCIGEGDDLDEMKHRAQEKNVLHMIEWQSFTAVENLPERLARIHVGIIGNGRETEEKRNFMLPVKMLEYAAMEIPTIVPRLKVMEMYFDESSAFFYTPDDAADLARVIQRVYSCRRLIESRVEGLRRFNVRYNWDGMSKRYLDIVGELVDADAIRERTDAMVPAYDGQLDEYYLHERYKGSKKKRSVVNAMYYALRPLLPRAVQLGLRRLYAKKQAQAAFPRWPIEPVLLERTNDELKQRLTTNGSGKIPLINFWPHGRRAAVILTHDVEWNDPGVKNIPRVRALERKYGVVSSWNFVAERYPFDKSIFTTLRDEGCEIGLHGLYHDGKKFSSRQIFEERLPTINAYVKEWGVAGFRSPATHRNPDWMPEIAVEYDSSFPDTDPFEPQAGGCCSIFPFFLGEIVELPITLVQDHTLIEILQKKDIELWKQKSEWIIENHGLVNIIVHPDYMVTEKNLWYYEEFLKFITAHDNLWFALPMDVARWWRERSKSKLVGGNGCAPRIEGPASTRGTIAWATLRSESVHYDLDNNHLHFNHDKHTMKIPFVDLNAQYQSLKHEILPAVERVMETSQFILGKAVEDFEKKFADAHGMKHCVGVGTGTDALHVILWALGVGPGDEVITVPHTFIATAEGISLTGAKPVFVDVDPLTYTMDPNRLEHAITKKTKAILPVHLYGQPAAMNEIMAIANRHGIPVVEDACQAHLAQDQGKFVGQFGVAAAFSFYPGKNLGAYGEGGGVTTNDDALARKMRTLRDHGSEKKYHHAVWGHNYRLHGMQGAVLGVKLPHLDAWTEARRANAARYNALLKGKGDLILPAERDGVKHVYHLYVVQTAHRDALQQHLAAREISTGLHYPVPLHLQEAYNDLGYVRGSFPVSERVASRGLSLPMFAELTDEQIEYVAAAIEDFFD